MRAGAPLALLVLMCLRGAAGQAASLRFMVRAAAVPTLRAPHAARLRACAHALTPRPVAACLQLGSCNKVDVPQKFWGEITRRAPAAWIWMGDNVYADTKRKTVLESAQELYNRLPCCVVCKA